MHPISTLKIVKLLTYENISWLTFMIQDSFLSFFSALTRRNAAHKPQKHQFALNIASSATIATKNLWS